MIAGKCQPLEKMTLCQVVPKAKEGLNWAKLKTLATETLNIYSYQTCALSSTYINWRCRTDPSPTRLCHSFPPWLSTARAEGSGLFSACSWAHPLLQLCVQGLSSVCVQHGRDQGRVQRPLRAQGERRSPLGALRGTHPLPQAWHSEWLLP